MPSISQLNVRLGLIYRDLDKGLESVERRLRQSGRRLSDLGDQMTLAISLPLAAAGAAAVKSAGNIESLQLALESQLGSAEAARKELELLRQAALAPGLGFEQAVKGSVSLQAVGFEAEKARKIITEFGNGLALAGAGAQELDGVVLALTQIQAKGVVSAEEINQIAERLPQIRTLMQQAFGTASSEAIQKLGISSQQFIEGITAELEKLPRATGGIKNSLENFFQAIQQGAAKFGFAISKAIDLPAKLESLSAGLSAIADGFSNLNPEVQQFVVYSGLAVVAAGPLAKLFGALKTTGAQVVDVFQGILAGAKTVGGAVLNASSAFLKLNTAMKFTVAGAVLAGVTALYFAFQELSSSMSDAERVSKSLEQVNRSAADSILDEKLRAEALIGVLKDQTATRDQQKKALAELQSISPQYFGRLDLEKSKVNDLNAALGGYVDSLLRAAKAQAAFEQLKDIEKNINNLRETSEPGFWQSVGNAFLSMGNAAQFAGKQGLTAAENWNEQKEALESQRTALQQVIKDNTELGVVTNGASDAAKKFNASVGDSAKLVKIYKEVISDIANVSAQQDLLGSERVLEQARAIESGIKKLLDAGFRPASKEVQSLKTQLQGLFKGVDVGADFSPLPTLPTPQSAESVTPSGTDALVKSLQVATPAMKEFLSVSQQLGEINMDFQGGLIGFAEAFQNVSNIVTANGSLMQQIFVGIGAAMQEAANSGASSLGALAGAAVAAAAKIVRAWVQQGVAAAVAKALGGLPFPINIAAAAGAGALAAAAFNKVLGAIQVPGFAEGVKNFGGGLAVVGEKGPELVKLPRGSDVTPNNELKQALGGDLGFVFYHKVQGSDLLFVLERAQRNAARTRGY